MSLDERPHFAAAKARIAAVHAELGAKVFRFGDVPGALRPDGSRNPGETPATYVALQVERMYLPTNKNARHSTVSGWRVSARLVGTDSDEAGWVGDKVTKAFENARLTIAGARSTPLQHDVSDPVDRDDGMFSGFVAYTYTI